MLRFQLPAFGCLQRFFYRNGPHSATILGHRDCEAFAPGSKEYQVSPVELVGEKLFQFQSPRAEAKAMVLKSQSAIRSHSPTAKTTRAAQSVSFIAFASQGKATATYAYEPNTLTGWGWNPEATIQD